jgi:hypothetical protein
MKTRSLPSLGCALIEPVIFPAILIEARSESIRVPFWRRLVAFERAQCLRSSVAHYRFHIIRNNTPISFTDSLT